MGFFKHKKSIIKSETFKPYEPWKELDKLRDIKKEKDKDEDEKNPCVMETDKPERISDRGCPWKLWGYDVDYTDDYSRS